MRPSAAAVALLPFSLLYLLLLVPLSTRASPTRSTTIHVRDDAYMHVHSAQPKSEINETEILQWHLPTPPSYWSIDIQDRDPDVARFPALITLHALFMSLAFFVALPAGIALRSAKHSYHGLAVVSFYALSALGCATSSLYRKRTPDMYQGSTHSTHGYIVLLCGLTLSAAEIAAFFHSSLCFLHNSFQTHLEPILEFEYSGLASEDPEEYDEIKPSHAHDHPPLSEHVIFDADSPRSARHSDDTLRDVVLTHIPLPKQHLLRRVAQAAYATIERSLVFAAFGMVLSGVVVYTGGCRDSYINGCLAHLIKGGIFWCYGLFTFARFLGSHSELGWAWNVSPIGNAISAEFVESTIIFLYGITNTWMERFGAKPGDPYTTKQVQHISIAVMFWFAGLVGMGMESRRVRRWLAASATAALGRARPISIAEPPSYRASLNPFPALVIGVTGAAMSAHAQSYIFQVQIHQLWGWLLLGFSVLRCLTYFFLWLGPPNSVLPSRPPTEALGSFFLAMRWSDVHLRSRWLASAARRPNRPSIMMIVKIKVSIGELTDCLTEVSMVIAHPGVIKRTARIEEQERPDGFVNPG
ncbi:hypothetical protein J3R82DRAFT_4464, partial [Butyriboletus roseoflavus]